MSTLERDIARVNRREMGKHWQELVWNGHGPWAGDPHLTLIEHSVMENGILVEEVECWYTLPNQEPQLVLRVPFSQFDIDKFCMALYKADNRTKSVHDKIAEADAQNELFQKELERKTGEARDEAIDAIHHTIVRDQDPGAPKQHLITKGAPWTPDPSLK